MATIILDRCENSGLWTSTDATNLALADEASIKKEGSGSIKITALFGKTQNITHAITSTPHLNKGTIIETMYFQAPNPGTLHKMDVCAYEATQIKAKAFYTSSNNWAFRGETNLVNVSIGENYGKTFASTLRIYKDDYIGYYTSNYIYATGAAVEAKLRSGDIASITTKASWANARFGMIGFYLSGSLDEIVYRDFGSGNEMDLRNMNIISFWVRANRTGTLLRFGFGLTAWSNHTFDVTINEADTWERKIIDLSDIDSNELNQVRYMGFRCANADDDTTLYIDDIRAQDNLLANSEAELGDTTGWTATDVTVEQGSSSNGVNLKVEIGEGELDSQLWGRWMIDYKPQLILTGWDGTYYFLFAATATLIQSLGTDDIGTLPQTFNINVKFKLVTTQNLWDATILSRITFDILYTDGTKDIFVIPCIRGINYNGHELLNSWLNIIINFALRENLGITTITVTGATDSLTGGLKVDWIKLKKNMEIIDDTLAKNAIVFSTSAFDLDGPNPPDKSSNTATSSTGFNEYLSFAQGEYTDLKMDYPVPRNYNSGDLIIRYEYSIDTISKRHTMQLRVTNIGPNSDHNPTLDSAFDISEEQISSETSGKRQIVTATIPQATIGWVMGNNNKLRLQRKSSGDTDAIRWYWMEFRWRAG